MFHSARIKLTLWYLLIIMGISLFFSVAFYQVSTREIRQMAERIQYRKRLPAPDFFKELDDATLQEIQKTKQHLIFILGLLNGFILLFTGAAGYLLAGKTLAPIQKMVEEQNRFIGDASHELRTPLTVLRSEIEAHLLDKKISSPDAKELLRSNLEEVINLQELSDNLLQLARFEDKRRLFILENVSLLQSIENALKKAAPLAKKKKIIIQNEVDDTFILGDTYELSQLFLIFLDNAIKYSPEKSRITLSSLAKDHHVEIKISDQGIGISEEELLHIFDRFYRADLSRTKKSIPGYGLGLSIAKKIIERHKGSISVASKVKKGTTFTITLPTA